MNEPIFRSDKPQFRGEEPEKKPDDESFCWAVVAAGISLAVVRILESL